jgi:hypothetical protein
VWLVGVCGVGEVERPRKGPASRCPRYHVYVFVCMLCCACCVQLPFVCLLNATCRMSHMSCEPSLRLCLQACWHQYRPAAPPAAAS